MYFRFSGQNPLRGIDLDHVKSRLKLCRMLQQPVFRRHDHSALLCRRHKLPCLAVFRIFSQLHFGKNKEIPMPGDDVNFAETAGKIAFKNPEPVFLEIAACRVLPEIAQPLFIAWHSIF